MCFLLFLLERKWFSLIEEIPNIKLEKINTQLYLKYNEDINKKEIINTPLKLV